MENDILDSLNDLGYQGPLSNEETFSKALEGGPKSLEFTKLIHILAEEIKGLCNLEETVNMMNDPDESSSFLLELSSFLRELGCPYKILTTGHMSSRLSTKEDRLLLLDYLISELMAARMVRVDCPKDKSSGMEIVMQESPTARDLKEILIALKFNKPPPSITPELLFTKLEAKLRETIQKEGEQLVGKPLYNKAMTEKEWKQLENVFTEMYEEYRLRRETLITRLECTIQSFEWSDRLKSQKDVIQSTYRPKREHMKVKPEVKLSDFLAARTSLLQVEKTSSATVRKNTQTDVNKVIIGKVPDRGGRPNEQQPPPPEMPSWQQRSAPQRGGGGGGGRGGGGGGGGAGRGGRGGGEGGRGGGRVQGGYTQGAGDQGRPIRRRSTRTTGITRRMKYRRAVMIIIVGISTKIRADMIRIAEDTIRILADTIRIVADMIRIAGAAAPIGVIIQAATKVVTTVWVATTRDITKVVGTRTTRASSKATRPKDTNHRTKGSKVGEDTNTNTTIDVVVAATGVADVNLLYCSVYLKLQLLSLGCLVR